ncbi:MAG: hypothetical protein JWQ30_1142, partial [Sediminibacterium sp.]|nr:hypothetical protein [Sediminibacterium sp.]
MIFIRIMQQPYHTIRNDHLSLNAKPSGGIVFLFNARTHAQTVTQLPLVLREQTST